MKMIKHVSASMTKNGPAFYKGQEIHPSVIDDGSDLLSQAMQDKDNLINAHGVKVIPVKKSVDGALPHFRIHDERYQEKLGVFGETIHNRFRDVTFQMLKHDGGKSLHRITAFDGMDRFQYGDCKCESEVDGYRPDVAVFHQDASIKGILALEVIHHSPPSKEKVLSYLDKGHIILRLNIADIVQTWMKQGYVASDQDIANYILQTRYKYPRNINRKYLNDVQLVWIDLLERERQKKLQDEDDRFMKEWLDKAKQKYKAAKEKADHNYELMLQSIERHRQRAEADQKHEKDEAVNIITPEKQDKIDKQRAELKQRHIEHEAELREQVRQAKAKIEAQRKANEERCKPCEHRLPCPFYLSNSCGPKYQRSVAHDIAHNG